MVQLEAHWWQSVLVGLILLSTTRAHAFCRTTTCDTGPDNVCTDNQAGCVPVFWKNRCLALAVYEGGSEEFSAEQIRTTLLQGASQWTAAECGGSAPAVAFVDTGLVSCDRVEFNRGGPNVNVVLFHDDEWPRRAAYALTTVQIRADTGEILGVDMEVNGADHDFALEGEPGTDLPSVITHELGHALGLAHSTVDGATMLAGYHAYMRDLELDDMAGICTIYPPGSSPPACNPMKNVSERCGGHVVGSCSTAAPRGRSGATCAAGFAALLVAWGRRRSKRR